MKKIILTLIAFLSIATMAAHAQTKKGTQKNKPVATRPAQQSTVKSTPVKTNVQTDESTYKNAIGIKFLYGISITGKHFFNPKNAIEAIVRYNGAGGLGSNIALTGLYEYHGNINGVQGLRWYVGGGAYANYFSWKDADLDPVTTFGIAGVIGLDYKIKGVPLAISADWQPAYVVSENIGFAAENGGIGVKYTFK